ncbi:MAG: cytochrome c, partial [Candidatus Omnitrophica bacterium]|nr:cytochrome c [Candidatus Omnitrophota bacterium]
VGFPEYGMPSFRHLTRKERWALVYYLKTLSETFDASETPVAIEVGAAPVPTAASIANGRRVYQEVLKCDACHGAEGRGDGQAATPDLVDDWGHQARPLDFTRGVNYFKRGARVQDIYLTVVAGLPGTPMPSYEGTASDEELWALAHYVADLAEQAEVERQRQWAEFELARREAFTLEEAQVAPEEQNWSARVSARYERVSVRQAREQGCLACHAGIEVINEKMQPYLTAFGGGTEGRSCAVCHEGNPEATTKATAHQGMYPNPSSLWVTGIGKGCAKCHSNREALTSLQAIPLPHPVGGSLMEVTSTATDPSGQTGRNHVYRMQRGLMALEFGKASHTLMSNGVVEKGQYLYADFDMDDPDGLTPSVGSDAYKQWVAKAIAEGFLKPVSRSQQIPTFEQGVALWGDEVKASFADYYRKECARCHVFEEGRRKRGDFRAGGCAACHVLYTNDGIYEGSDPTIPKEKGLIHPIKHEITAQIPATQCNHCHTRGKRIGTTYVGAFEFDYVKDQQAIPFDETGHPQEPLYTKEYMKIAEDVHFQKGIQCIECHTSIDVHGDGNIYPTTLYQVEVQCQDCHGTPEAYPWELPVGFGGGPVTLEGPRGTFTGDDGTEYLLTSRGNARGNLEKRDEAAVLVSFYDKTEHPIPLLKEKHLHNTWKTKSGQVAMASIPQHLTKLECYTCHSTWAPQCYGCHTQYDRRQLSTDWLLTALNHDPRTGKQRITETPGKVVSENRSFMRWEEPILGINLKGKVSPVIPGCQVFWTYIDEDGKMRTLNKPMETSDGFAGPTMAPVQPHANAIPARTCESCHTNPKAIGYGTANSRSQGELRGDAPHFQNLAEGFYGDLPGSKTAKWQVPKIEEFPYALDQLVTRSGKQVQNMPHVEDRPLNTAERNKVEREGLCVACHQHYNTPLWEQVKQKVGPALTPDQHDRAVEAALRALAEPEQ